MSATPYPHFRTLNFPNLEKISGSECLTSHGTSKWGSYNLAEVIIDGGLTSLLLTRLLTLRLLLRLRLLESLRSLLPIVHVEYRVRDALS